VASEPLLRVALTGGIASGKSTVSNLFAELGVTIIDADLIAREVVAPGTALLQQLYQRFGAQLRRSDGSLDRAALRSLVFADRDKRQELEALLHPAIRRRSEALVAQAKGDYLLQVIPLLVETNAASRFDRVVVVDCPEAQQLARLMTRDGCDPRQAQALLAAQSSRSQRLAAATDVILNDGEPAALKPKVAALHDKFLALAAARDQRFTRGEPLKHNS
jgi:dephospho-CoA kinase